ncbi:WbqC family protein [Flavobacteriaceae bacterium]|nr:WbqC family protein [Flavobacteriaceae bacterium]MDB4298469.1 WbqC family protein [Flavobacteriaceae bacterium]MDB9911517.1 WbqC family protein [Flavobacteriaceae bacterium]
MERHILIYPSYFPSIATMVAMAKADKITLETQDNYQKQTYRNRTYIAHSNGKLLLNIPIRHSKSTRHQKTKDVTPENNFSWLAEHWKSIQVAYRTSPYFEFYEDDLAPLFKEPVLKLQDFNIQILETIAELIGLEAPITTSSVFQKHTQLQDMRHLGNCKKEPSYNFDAYHQVFEGNHGHIENLSILDLLFNEGPNTLNYLQSQTL